MKKLLKRNSVLTIGLVCLLLLSSCSFNERYKRIDLTVQTLDGEETELEKTVALATKVESKLTQTFADTMPVYEITPREITHDELMQMRDYFGVNGKERYVNDSILIEDQDGIDLVRLKGNELCYTLFETEYEHMTQSDDELIAEAKRIFSELPIIEGEYECTGVLSTQTQTSIDRETLVTSEEEVVSKRIGFRKLIDGTRVLGDEIISLYFCSSGFYEIRMELYDYEKIGEIPMMTLEEALEKVKEPDNFSIDGEGFSEKADILCIERASLLFVNQYSNGCTILQPVFNLVGTAENEKESAEFSAKIIAIPEKYTYVD